MRLKFIERRLTVAVAEFLRSLFMKAHVTTLALCALFTLSSAAQTMNDPFPLIGNQAQAIAGTMAINSHIRSGSGATTCEKKTRWERHMDNRTACRKPALNYPVGKQRQAIRDRCNALYPVLPAPSCN
jgi:hypothetical protein